MKAEGDWSHSLLSPNSTTGVDSYLGVDSFLAPSVYLHCVQSGGISYLLTLRCESSNGQAQQQYIVLRVIALADRCIVKDKQTT